MPCIFVKMISSIVALDWRFFEKIWRKGSKSFFNAQQYYARCFQQSRKIINMLLTFFQNVIDIR